MGHDADVQLDDLQIRARALAATGALVATPAPGARLGRPIRFSLVRRAPDGASAVPAGSALATVYVSVDHARAVRPIERGESCVEADVEDVRGPVGGVLLQRLPRKSDVLGARALRTLAEDEIVTRSVVAVRPAVQSGDAVAVRAMAGAVTVEGQGIAIQSGSPGDIIRVVNQSSRRSLKVRVVAAGQVEVVQ